jgi:hypothetical protein
MSSRRTILGAIRFRDGREIRLLDDGSWQIDRSQRDPLMRFRLRALRVRFADYSYSPADGEPGAKLLADAADFLLGESVWLAPPSPPLPEGAVY